MPSLQTSMGGMIRAERLAIRVTVRLLENLSRHDNLSNKLKKVMLGARDLRDLAEYAWVYPGRYDALALGAPHLARLLRRHWTADERSSRWFKRAVRASLGALTMLVMQCGHTECDATINGDNESGLCESVLQFAHRTDDVVAMCAHAELVEILADHPVLRAKCVAAGGLDAMLHVLQTAAGHRRVRARVLDAIALLLNTGTGRNCPPDCRHGQESDVDEESDEDHDEDQDEDHDEDQESDHDEDQESDHDEDGEDDDQDRRTRYVFPEFAELARLVARNDGLLFKALLNTKLRSLAAYYLSRAATDAFPGLYWQLIEAESIDERDALITAAYGELCRMVQDPVTLAAAPLDCA
jgi:hypothetical protein